jgi:tol-pal system protein YbgF
MLGKATIVALVALVAGCAGLRTPPPAPEGQKKLEDLARSQARIEMRVDEVTRNLLALRERIEAQDAAIKTLRDTTREAAREDAEDAEDAKQEAVVPLLPVVKVEPLAAAPSTPEARKPPAAQPSAPRNPPPAGAPTPRPESTPEQGAAADLYRRAFNGFREARYGQAILDFEEFLRRYPNHEYADNAQYWIGECYYSQNEYEQAILEFSRVLERYPRESKAPDALVKIGLCYEKLGDPGKARVFWKRVVSEYSDTEAAGQARKLLGG